MTIATKRQPYHTPQITRVLLRREQAVLSPCTTLTSNSRDSASTGGCVHRGKGVGQDICKGWSSTDPTQDSGGRPS